MYSKCPSATLPPYLYAPHVDRVIECHPATVSPDVSVAEAILPVHQSKHAVEKTEAHRIQTKTQPTALGYMLAVKDLIPAGILTDTDIVGLLAANIDLQTVKVADVMQPLAILKRLDLENLSSSRIIEQLEQFRFLGIVNEQGEFEGIITERSFIAGLKETDAILTQYSSVCYRDIVESQGELICRCLAANMTITYISSNQCIFFFDKQPEELITQSFMALILEADRQGLKYELDNLSVIQPTITYSTRVIKPNNTLPLAATEDDITWLEWSIRGFFDAEGDIVGYQAVGRDITLRKQNEQELQQTQNLYRSIFETVNDGIFVNDLETGVLVEANPVACRMHGYSHKELLSISPSQYVHPDSYHVFAEFIETVKTGREYVSQAVGVRKDGSLFDVEIQGTTITYDGKVYGLSAIRDISDSKRLELALQNSQAKLTDILNNSEASIVNFRLFANRTWEYEYQSRGSEKLFGYTAEEIMGNNTLWISRVFPLDLENVIMPAFDKLFQEDITQIEYRFYHKDGSIRWVSATYTSRRDEIGNYWVVTGVSNDITGRKSIELIHEQLNHELETRVQKRTTELALTIEKLNQEILERALVETQLRQSESHFRTLFDANLVGIIFSSLNGEITDANDYFLQMVGYTREEMAAGQVRWTDLTPPEYAYTNIQIHEQLRQQGFCSSIEKVYFRKDKTYVPVIVAVGLLEQGKEDTIGVILDISERQAAILDRQRAEAIFRQQVERELLIGTVTQRIHDFLDLTAVINTTIIEVKKILKVDRVVIYQSNNNYEYIPIAEAISPGNSSALNGAYINQLFPNEIYQRCLQQGIYVFSDRDSENLEAEHREFWLDLQIQAMIIVPIVQENQVWGLLSVHQCSGTREWQTWEINLLIEVINQLALAIRQSELYQKLQVELRERTNAEENLKKLNQTLTETNAELAHATRLKDEFLASMSHELRTPLNAILGLSEGLLDEVYATLTEKQKIIITTIHNSGKHLLDLINDILDLAKIESGNIDLHPSLVSIKTLCDSSCTFIKQQAKVKNIQLSVEVACKQTQIWVDERRIIQVLINLLSNAVKFTPNGGQVWLIVDTDTKTQEISFCVQDTGIGIDSKDIDKLFQPFIQIDSTLSRNYSGTGLGLALVRKIIEMHHGRVAVKSQVGKGSCFTVKLPCDNKSLQKVPAPYTNILLESGNSQEQIKSINIETCRVTGQPLILLAEDNQTNIESMTDFLEYCGYQFMVARNGLEAIQFAFTEKPQLILMDIQMPEMDGLAAISQIRTQPELMEIPIIALTALAMPGDKQKCIQAGADEYISKPVSLKKLSSLIKKLLKRDI
jgi:PAS domain S-box-containing protein